MYRLTRNPVSLPAVQNIQTAVNRIFDEAFEEFFPGAKPRTGPSVPAVDIYETADSIVFEMELPGVEKSGVSIAIDAGLLSLTGSRSEVAGQERTYHRRERDSGRFERSFQVPAAADPEKIQARLEQGVLTLTIPKRVEAKARSVEIKVE